MNARFAARHRTEDITHARGAEARALDKPSHESERERPVVWWVVVICCGGGGGGGGS